MKTGKYYKQNQCRIAILTAADWECALRKCESHLEWKLKNKTVYGVHNAANLGEDPIDYYIGVAYEKIIFGDWEWKAKYSLAEQLIRIIDSYISKSVEKKSTAKAEALKIVYTDNDVSEFGDSESDGELLDNEQTFIDRVNLIDNAIEGDEELVVFFSHTKEGKDFEDIATLMKMDRKSIYRLNERLKYKLKQII